MIKKYVLFLSFIFSLISVSPSFGLLHLVLTQGVDSAIPIAIMPFQFENSTFNISSIISNDLYHSGQFKPSDKRPASIPFDPSEVKYTYFQKEGVNYLVIGKIEPKGKDYRVSYSLLEVYMNDASKQKTGISTSPVLLEQAFIIKPNQFRTLSHKIADAIYEKITGEKGFFSTKIAYILVQMNQANERKSPVYKLMIADYDGLNAQPILVSKEPIMSPAWSPDGKSIAYVSFEDRLPAIYISHISSGKRRLIVHIAGINGAPSFSPDGQYLALVLSKLEQPNIYLINLSDGHSKKITEGYAITTEPSFSKDGKSLLMTSDKGGTPQIYQMDLQNYQIKRLTYNGNYNAQAEFFPNNQEIVMLHRGEDTQNRFGIAIQNILNGTNQVLTSENDQSPSIAPNGEMIIYTVTNNSGKTELAMISKDGKIRINIPSEEGDVREPSWSPFLNH